MKIAIDISQIIYETGVSIYTKNLVENLLKIDKANDYIFFGGSLRGMNKLKSVTAGMDGKYFLKTLPLPPTLADFIWNKLHILPIDYFIGKVDVFHSSDWTQPPSGAFKVTTIHDIVPIKYPEYSHPRIVTAHKMRLKHVKNEVDRVIVPSLTTKADLVTEGFSEEKIRIIPEAPDPIFKRAKKLEVERMKRKYQIKGKYLLAVGISKRKNSQGIIEGYQKLELEDELKMVFVGEPKEKNELPSGVIILGHVPLWELPLLYSGAEALVYPSFSEGFGLPILEAFRCEIPVVTSNRGSMKEICENAAVLVDPYNSDSIAEGIIKAFKNRERYVKRGRVLVKRFSWEKTARKTLDVYKESLIINR